MAKSTIKVITLLILLNLNTGPAYSAPWSWMESSPASHFNETDWEILRETARDLLDNGDNGTSRSWSNPDTQNSGTITVINKGQIDGQVCRRIRFENIAGAKNLSGTGTYFLCKQEDGTWKIVP